MKSLKRPSSLIVSLAALLAFTTASSFLTAEAAHHKKDKEDDSEAAKVYHQVWDLIQKNYFDPTFNDQDWSYWEHRYDGKLESEDDEQKAIDTMLASLGERFTRYLNKQSFSDETTQIAGKLYGIGIQIAPNAQGKIVVVAPVEGSPAAAAGFKPNDLIEEIDGKPTNGMTVQQASNMIRGPMDTVVTLKIVRNGETKEIPVTRGEIKLKSVQTVKMLNSGIGYIRLSTFMSSTAGQEVQDALVQLTPARGIILDLRGNPGGLVTNAIEVCSLFIQGGVIVSTVGRDPTHPLDTRVSGKKISTQPLVVLLDEGTASAAEITSGALHDTGRADLVGAKHSFGKGLVQSVTKLLDGSGVNLTIARYLTPNGSDIHKKGIVPDYIVELDQKDINNQLGPWWYYKGPNGKEPDPVGAKDIQLAKAEEVMEAKLKAADRPYELKLENMPFNLQ